MFSMIAFCINSVRARRMAQQASYRVAPAVRQPSARRMAFLRLLAALALLTALPMAASAQPIRAPQPVNLVALGDSLTAGLGLAEADAFPAKLQDALRAKGYAVTITNAGVSGDTTADGLARLDWSVPDGTDAVIVELGANDALRGLDPALARKSLDAILSRLHARGLPILLCGMRSPPNLGDDYAKRFEAIFPDLAKQYGALLYPFFLDGVAAQGALTQADGLHPTAAGVDVIVQKILPQTEALLAAVAAKRKAAQR
jgi:acyl-CoA thioesterase-1